jgi:hypothetical protein
MMSLGRRSAGASQVARNSRKMRNSRNVAPTSCLCRSVSHARLPRINVLDQHRSGSAPRHLAASAIRRRPTGRITAEVTFALCRIPLTLCRPSLQWFINAALHDPLGHDPVDDASVMLHSVWSLSSSSLMRLVAARVACGLARNSSGAANAVVALARHFASSSGYAPCARHHALLSASFIAAVVTTASSRLPEGGRGPHILAPALQGVRADPNLSRNHVDRCALRRQQPRYRSVFECLSVSSQVGPSSPPPGLIYGGDNYSDAGGLEEAAQA